MNHTQPSGDTDGLCKRILDREVDLDDLAAQEHEMCDAHTEGEPTLKTLAVLETLQEIRRSCDRILRWRELIDWCKKKSRTAQPELREMYNDAIVEYLTSAAHRFYFEITPAEQGQILLQSSMFSDPAEYLFHILNQKYGPQEEKAHRMAA